MQWKDYNYMGSSPSMQISFLGILLLRTFLIYLAYAFCGLILLLQLNKYKTEPYFLQFFQSNMTVCLIIHVFCKSCKPEIVLSVLQIKTKTISRLQTLQKHE